MYGVHTVPCKNENDNRSHSHQQVYLPYKTVLLIVRTHYERRGNNLAAIPAVAIAGLAISAAGTAASIASQMSQGGGSAGAKSAQASIDQLNYLEEQQRKKNALSTEMIETAKKFANQQYDLDIQNLQQIRDVNQQQLMQQRIIAEQNYVDNQRSIQDQRLENAVNDANTDFGKQLQLQQANLTRDLGDLQRTGQYRLKETGRKISDLNTDLGVDNARNQQELERTTNQAQYDIQEGQADLSLMTEQQQLALGREQALLEYMRGKDQLATDSQLLNISQAGVEQSAAYQKMSQDLQLYSELTGLDQERRKGQVAASNNPKLAGQMSTSDYRANLAASGVDSLIKAQGIATLNNHMMKGSLNNQLDINLAEIQTKRLGLEQTASQLNTNLSLDETARRQQVAQLQAARQLETLKNKVGMFILPEAARRLQMMGVEQQAATSKMGNQLERMNDQSGLANQALTDEYQRGLDETLYDMDARNTQMSRTSRDSDLTQAGSQNDLQYKQALLDLLYGNQALDKNFEMGASSAEAARLSTMQSRDIDQLNQLANQRAALSQALSAIQPNLIGGGGGGRNWAGMIQEVGGLFNQAANLWSNRPMTNPQQSRYMVNDSMGGALTNPSGVGLPNTPRPTVPYQPSYSGDGIAGAQAYRGQQFPPTYITR